MRHAGRIKAAYDWFEAHALSEMSRATQADDAEALRVLQDRLDVLTRGAFVLLFGQFENTVNETFARAREARIDHQDWSRRRGWDTPALAGSRVAFETRLSMILDRRQPAFAQIIAAYAIRNHCAHGGMSLVVGSIAALEADIHAWRGALRA